MESTTSKRQKKQGRTQSQPTAPTTTTCTSPRIRHPPTTAPAGNFAAEHITAPTPSQSRKLPTDLTEAIVTTASLSHHPSGLAPRAPRSLSEADGPNIADSKNVVTHNEKSRDQSSGSANPSSLQTYQAPTSSAVPEDIITPSTTSSGHGDTTSIARPFSTRQDNIDQIRGFASPNSQKRPAVGDPEDPSTSHRPSPQTPRVAQRAQKHSAEPWSAATTPRPKRAKALNIGSRRFACPFRKKNPFLYRDDTCKHGHKRISDVKQHLYRRHMMHICNRCGSQFKLESELTNHQRQLEGCKLIRDEDHEDPAGITPKQKALLHRRADPKKDEGEQWGIMWRIVFPKLAHLEPSPYVDDSEKVDAVFQFAHTNGLNIARAIPGMDNIPEAAIQAFIEKIRNALMSSGQVEDIPPPMDSPGSDDSPQGEEATHEPTVLEPQPVFVKDQPVEEKEEGMTMMEAPIATAEDQMNSDMQELMFNMPLDFGYLQPNVDGWYNFGQPLNPMAFQPPEKGEGQTDFAGPASLSQISCVDYLPMARPGGRVMSTEQEESAQSKRDGQGGNQK